MEYLDAIVTFVTNNLSNIIAIFAGIILPTTFRILDSKKEKKQKKMEEMKKQQKGDALPPRSTRHR